MWLTHGWDPITMRAWHPKDVVWPIWSHSGHSAFCVRLNLTFTCVFPYRDRTSAYRPHVNSRCKCGLRVRISRPQLLRFWPFWPTWKCNTKSLECPLPLLEKTDYINLTSSLSKICCQKSLKDDTAILEQQLQLIFSLQFLMNVCLINS